MTIMRHVDDMASIEGNAIRALDKARDGKMYEYHHIRVPK
jgi:hypothetical protein